MRPPSTIITHEDTAGKYEIETFDAADPRRVFVTAHGNGVRRWDGKHFYHVLAEHYPDDAVLLVDQNQVEGEGIKINPLPVLVARVQGLIRQSKLNYPGVPIVVVGHSMGCAVTTFLDLTDVSSVIFVAPAAGTPQASLIERYGADIANGRTISTSDNLIKIVSAECYNSLAGIIWEDEYKKLAARFSPIHVYESGDEEIVSDERFKHRSIPFTSYGVIPGAKHNLNEGAVKDFLARLDKVI